MDSGGNSIPDDVTVDSRGIPGWEEVPQLATAFLNLRGLSLSNGEAQETKIPWILMIRVLQKCCSNPKCS